MTRHAQFPAAPDWSELSGRLLSAALWGSTNLASSSFTRLLPSCVQERHRDTAHRQPNIFIEAWANWLDMSPLRVKSRPQSGIDGPPRTPSPFRRNHADDELPEIGDDDSFRDVIKKLSM